MHYLVTGGCGFIGSHLCDALIDAGHKVFVIDDLSTGKKENLNQNATLQEACITQKGVFDKLVNEVDGVFHLAAVASVERSRLEWLHTHAVNVSGMVNLLEAITRRSSPIPVVYASSAAVYGDNPDLPLHEEAVKLPQTAYGADKLGCEQHAKVGFGVHGIPSMGMRFFNVFGPRQDPSSPYSGVVSIFTDRIGKGQSITIFGDGGQTRDFIYVGDIVRALQAAMQVLHDGSVTQDVTNVCTGYATDLIALAKAIGQAAGQEVEMQFAEARIGDIRASIGDPEKMNRVLGVKAEMDIVEGLRLTMGMGA